MSRRPLSVAKEELADITEYLEAYAGEYDFARRHGKDLIGDAGIKARKLANDYKYAIKRKQELLKEIERKLPKKNTLWEL